MKNLNKYLLVLLVIVLSTGCTDDFLDTEPKTTLTDDSFYQTKEDAELAIVGCYDGIQQLYASGVAFPILSEVLSDNCFGGTGNTDALNFRVLDEFDLSVSSGEVNILNNNWIAYYKAIYRINVLLQKLDQINWEGDEAYRNSIEAQARFLRAYCYFDMVRIWEKVPLITEPTTGNISQAEVDEIYTVIAEDLSFAAENGSETVEPGRVNKWAAKAYLARVFLFYTGYYGNNDLVGVVSKAQALQGLEDVIAKGSYSLVEKFKNLWPAASSVPEGDGLTTTYAGKDNAETVFAIKYNITSDYDGNTDGNHWLVLLGFRGQTFSPYGSGWGACTVSPDLYAVYEDDDARREASIIAIEEEELDYDNDDQREYTGYSGKKYIPLANPDGSDVAVANGAVDFQIGQYQDYVVMRYSDVLLMAAELGSASAQTYFDQVRDRAGLTSLPATFNNIMKERRLEFALEGIRYWDLLRQGVNVAAETIAEETTVMNGGVPTDKSILAANVIETRGFQMIPQNQVTRSSGVLKQNSGWE
ncbi:RagB/SusD family nutrient uptake outer membrane protein [Fulvivirga kasyanovii]|uniref:RagB/SusD family nutrient uptake outer membrane protein n=1 Tax=Fulvivirga kasyanovii TaxID=396812 RepID=A0ABW9RTI1_9BACT|nr:RagB/SusD family nutrient uptake outer membrane protein [Fulvivirga kasyanovii]MTI27494.1 RagB/SusD family nutrient uptake outer membrane protein [Fulvivirga kasyanovii]